MGYSQNKEISKAERVARKTKEKSESCCTIWEKYFTGID